MRTLIHHRSRCGIAGTIMVLSMLLAAAAAAAQTGSGDPPFPPPGRLIDLGGWRLHLHCTGEADATRPTVILEAGAGDFSMEWSLVQPGVAGFARVCSYDRAGTGWSDLGPRPRTMRQIVSELHTLLEKAGERPPYVLVGHSFGGLLVRLYAAMFPEDVAGAVLVDIGNDNPVRFINGTRVRMAETATGRPIPPVKTSNPLRVSDIPPAALSQIAAAAAHFGTTANEPPRDRLPPEAQKMRTWTLSQLKHYASNDNPFEAEELALVLAERLEGEPLFGDRPLVVVTSGLSDFEGAEAHSLEEDRQRYQADLVRLARAGKQVIARRSGHHVQLEEPELVIASIRDVVAAARR